MRDSDLEGFVKEFNVGNKPLSWDTQSIPFNLIDGDIRPTSIPRIDPEHGREPTHKQFIHQNAPTDEVGNVIGIPHTSALILRNLARNLPKAVAMTEGIDHEALRLKAMEEVFGPIRERLIFVMAHNRMMTHWASEILALIEKGMAT